MPTKRFVWKDRDAAALDLIQLAYHAPQPLSQNALYILSAIRSPSIVPDLKAITLDAERDTWERICALRALTSVPGDFYFPELAAIVEQDLLRHQQIIAQSDRDLHHVFIPNNMLEDILDFALETQSNRAWLLQRLDQADPPVLCRLLTSKLNYQMSEEFAELLRHRLIVLLEANPNLITLYLVHELYNPGQSDELVRTFLNDHFDVIVQKAISSAPSPESHRELSWDIPFEWPELKAVIFRLRPDLEEKYLRDEAAIASEGAKFREQFRYDLFYKETAIWREFEALYERANKGDSQAKWKLYHKSFQDGPSIPIRAAATHFLGKLGDQPLVTENLALLTQRPNDTWEGYYSPVRFVAGLALFRIGTPQAWEALVAACFVSPGNFLATFLLEWIDAVTDKLSGVPSAEDEKSERYSRIQNRWFRALVDPEERSPGSNGSLFDH